MGKRNKDALWVAILSVVCGLIIWHVVYWQSTGMYREMFDWIGTDKTYVVVLYNLGLMSGFGFILGFLMRKITDLIGYGVRKVEHFKEEEYDNKK